MGFVLGLSGAALAGKDTVADYLISEHGWTGKLSFAKNLKDMCREVFDLSEEDVETQEGKKRRIGPPIQFSNYHFNSIINWMLRTHSSKSILTDSLGSVQNLTGKRLKSPREVLQFVGTDICRALVPTYHVDIILNSAAREGNWVITDVRFPNEGDLVLDVLKGAVVNINRASSSEGIVDMTHLSETAMKQWGRYTDIIDNSKDGLEFLFEEVNEFLERNNLNVMLLNSKEAT
jgi:hypothetical protein